MNPSSHTVIIIIMLIVDWGVRRFPCLGMVIWVIIIKVLQNNFIRLFRIIFCKNKSKFNFCMKWKTAKKITRMHETKFFFKKASIVISLLFSLLFYFLIFLHSRFYKVFFPLIFQACRTSLWNQNNVINILTFVSFPSLT